MPSISHGSPHARLGGGFGVDGPHCAVHGSEGTPISLAMRFQQRSERWLRVAAECCYGLSRASANKTVGG